MKTFILAAILFLSTTMFCWAQPEEKPVAHFELNDVVVTKPYDFKSEKEKTQYQVLLDDMRVVYPLLVIIRTEYNRINKELNAYEGKRKKEFLKWYENYAREKYMTYLGTLNTRQGRLFLKLISRELDKTPYKIIKEYRNGFRATVWQTAAIFLNTNLKVEYNEAENPMIEHIIKKLDAENLAVAPTARQ